jgi:hypothetical protein
MVQLDAEKHEEEERTGRKSEKIGQFHSIEHYKT